LSTGLVVALLSGIAFLGAGAWQWNGQVALILTGVVLFHEMGHLLAMRMLRYRDVRMFFIPLLGAAVTGRHYNVKGWQRAIVYLAGPLPGIIVGLLLALIAVNANDRLLERIAMMALVLNGINLLPFVPLDGGWVLHSLIFSRHYFLESIFIGLAGLILIVATWLG